MPASVLSHYGLDERNCSVTPFGDGLINHTWKIISGEKEFLLQRINQLIFLHPPDIMSNLKLLEDYFKSHYPDYLFVAPLNTTVGQNFVKEEGENYYRLFQFVPNSYTCNTVSEPSLAYEASRQFGRFTRLLTAFDPSRLKITLPDFHNLSLRQQQFESALLNGNKKRIEESAETIAFLKDQEEIVNEFEKIKANASLPVRVIHHDAKINNVLFDRRNQAGLCLVDLDTVMPGYYISDVGDMLRTYISPVDEEESDSSLIRIREEYFHEIVRGYLGEMNSQLTETEKKYFIYSGKFAIYMQAVRFLTDYINDDIYYGVKYEGQNLTRANNQTTLLKRFVETEKRLQEILESYLKNNSI